MEMAGSLIASEVATLKYIKRNSSVPVPEVFAFRYVKHLACWMRTIC